MKLVPDWKRAYRWFSMQAMALSLALLGAWELLPADLKEALPEAYTRVAAIVLLLAGLAGRLVKQEKD